jgi:hypothetical protein
MPRPYSCFPCINNRSWLNQLLLVTSLLLKALQSSADFLHAHKSVFDGSFFVMLFEWDCMQQAGCKLQLPDIPCDEHLMTLWNTASSQQAFESPEVRVLLSRTFPFYYPGMGWRLREQRAV